MFARRLLPAARRLAVAGAAGGGALAAGLAQRPRVARAEAVAQGGGRDAQPPVERPPPAACPACGSKPYVNYLDAAAGVRRGACCDVPEGARGAACWRAPLVKEGTEGVAMPAEGAEVVYRPDFVAWGDGPLLKQLLAEVAWQQHSDVLASGAREKMPRLIAYQADDPANPRLVYDYENLDEPLRPEAWTPAVRLLKDMVEEALGLDALPEGGFNTAHLNWYRDGGDHVSWHTDEDVPLYGPEPVIASVSLGAQRDFVLRPLCDSSPELEGCSGSPPQWLRYSLPGGSLLVMRGTTQRHFEHSIRKSSGPCGPRVNITFRRVVRTAD